MLDELDVVIDQGEESLPDHRRIRLTPEAKSLLERVALKIEEDPDKTDVRFFKTTGECGTTYCIGGWTVVLGDPAYLEEFGHNIGHRARELLGLGQGQSMNLFYLSRWPEQFRSDDGLGRMSVGSGEVQGTREYAKVVAQRVRFFIRTEGRDIA